MTETGFFFFCLHYHYVARPNKTEGLERVQFSAATKVWNGQQSVHGRGIPVTQWLEHPTGVKEVVGPIPA